MSFLVLHWALEDTNVMWRHMFLVWCIIYILVGVLIILQRLKVIFIQFQLTVVFHIQICKLPNENVHMNRIGYVLLFSGGVPSP